MPAFEQYFSKQKAPGASDRPNLKEREHLERRNKVKNQQPSKGLHHTGDLRDEEKSPKQAHEGNPFPTLCLQVDQDSLNVGMLGNSFIGNGLII